MRFGRIPTVLTLLGCAAVPSQSVPFHRCYWYSYLIIRLRYQVRLYGGSDLGQLPLADVKSRLQRAVTEHGAFDATPAASSNGSAAQADAQLEVQAEL